MHRRPEVGRMGDNNLLVSNEKNVAGRSPNLSSTSTNQILVAGTLNLAKSTAGPILRDCTCAALDRH